MYCRDIRVDVDAISPPEFRLRSAANRTNMRLRVALLNDQAAKY